MKKVFLPAFLLVVTGLLTGLTALAQSGFDSGASANSDPCLSKADMTMMDRSNQRQQWTISYELLESILARGDGFANDVLAGIMTGPPQGELVAVFAVTEHAGLGVPKVNNPIGQAEFDHLTSVDGLTISEYGLINVPWRVILENGLPQLPADSTSATFVCKPVNAAKS